jgi:hypothetical protein
MQCNNGKSDGDVQAQTLRIHVLKSGKKPGISTHGERRRMTHEIRVSVMPASSSRVTAGTRHAKSSSRCSKRISPLSIPQRKQHPSHGSMRSTLGR